MGAAGQSQAGVWGQLAWPSSAPILCRTLISFIDLCCNEAFEDTICHDRPEEEEMDFAGLSF